MATLPTRWEEVPGSVREALASVRQFRKAANPAEARTAGSPTLAGLADLFGWRAGPLQETWGGPRPLTSTLIGAGVGALGGHLAGRATEWLSPPGTFEEGEPRKRFAVLGAGLGAVPGIYQGIDNATQGKAPWDVWPAQKQAAAGDMFVPIIDRDQFVQQVMRDPFTPMRVRAATAGLVEAAGEVTDKTVLTPWDVSRVALAAGSGAASGYIVGKTLGVLAGLSPSAQKSVQEAGWWSGVLGATVPRALGFR